jgi:hypothetical protein
MKLWYIVFRNESFRRGEMTIEAIDSQTAISQFHLRKPACKFIKIEEFKR